MPLFFIFAVCAFASGFALRLVDPIVLPVAAHFQVAPAQAALLNTAFALPYALAQPFLGALGDRFGKPRCVQVCVAGLAVMLAAGALAPTFPILMTTRVLAGIFAGGLIPLVIAGLGDTYGMAERQVAIGRMLFAIISGQMLGSVVSGLANAAFGWHASLVIAALLGAVAAAIAWFAMPASANDSAARSAGSMRAMYAQVFANPKAVWLIGCVMVEGMLFYGFFPFMSEMLVAHTNADRAQISVETGIVLGAFGIGGLAYAAAVRVVLRRLGMRRMCLVGTSAAALAYAAIALTTIWWLAAVAMLLAGFAFYMTHNSLQTEATELAPAARGSSVALLACGFFAGQGLGPLLFGGLLHLTDTQAAMLGVAVAVLVLGRVVVAKVVGTAAARPVAARVR